MFEVLGTARSSRKRNIHYFEEVMYERAHLINIVREGTLIKERKKKMYVHKF